MWKQTGQRKALLAVLILVSIGDFWNSPSVWARTGPGISEWENEIKAFEASDTINPPPKDAILFIGSSSIQLWQSLAHDFRSTT